MGSIYILPTRSWIVLSAVLVAMWYAAVSQSNSAAYLLMFFLGSLVVVSMFHAHFALAGLSTRIGRIAPVFAGDNARVPVEVSDLTGRLRLALSVAPNGSVFREVDHTRASPLSPKGTVGVELALPTSIRGRHRVKRVAVTTIYPLGFFRSWRYQATEAEYVVYPAPAGHLPLPGGVTVAEEVNTGSGRGGDDYAGVRNYQTGESQRHVDWRAVARGQPLLIKQFTGAGSRRLWFDYAELSYLPGVEARLSQLCRWIVDAEEGAYSYGLRVANFVAEPSRGGSHYARCLEALATAFPLPPVTRRKRFRL